MTNLSQRIAALSPEQRAHLAGRLNAVGLGALESDPIQRRAADDAIPLSFAQRRLWFLHRLEPASPSIICRSQSGSAVPSTGRLCSERSRRS